MSGGVTFPLHRVIYYGTLDTAGNGGVDSVRAAGTPGETLYLEGLWIQHLHFVCYLVLLAVFLWMC